MTPELENGWKVLVDTENVQPVEGALVAVYIKDEGGILGRWHVEDGKPMLTKANRKYSSIVLGERDEWTLWGTVMAIVHAPVQTTTP